MDEHLDFTNDVSTDSNVSTGAGQDRQALRAFIHRAETRLSTMHRIAGLFVGGAGLLVLFPAFLTPAISVVGGRLVSASNFWLQVLCAIGGVTTLSLPLYALLLLLKDLVQFYFTAEHPNHNLVDYYPRFVLSGITLSTDEAPGLRQKYLECQQEPTLIRFVLPYQDKLLEEFDEIYRVTHGNIVPTDRKDAVEALDNDPALQTEYRRLQAALGMTGTVDRDLVGEAAKIEASLVRHAIYLKRLVLRYMKAIILFIYTFLVTSIVGLILSRGGASNPPDSPSLLRAICVYMLWCFSAHYVVRRPMSWIYQLGNKNHRARSKPLSKDMALNRFEVIVAWVGYSIGGILAAGLLLEWAGKTMWHW